MSRAVLVAFPLPSVAELIVMASAAADIESGVPTPETTHSIEIPSPATPRTREVNVRSLLLPLAVVRLESTVEKNPSAWPVAPCLIAVNSEGFS